MCGGGSLAAAIEASLETLPSHSSRFAKACGVLREVPEPRCALSQVTLEPSERTTLVLGRAALRVQLDELEGILERELRKLTSRIFGHPEGSALDRSAEADVRVRLRRQERMFPYPLSKR
jgi:hypothetical protein